MKKHSVSIRGHRTSFSLEEPFWEALKAIARERGEPVARLVTRLDARRAGDQNLSSAIRVFVLRTLQQRVDSRSMGGSSVSLAETSGNPPDGNG